MGAAAWLDAENAYGGLPVMMEGALWTEAGDAGRHHYRRSRVLRGGIEIGAVDGWQYRRGATMDGPGRWPALQWSMEGALPAMWPATPIIGAPTFMVMKFCDVVC